MATTYTENFKFGKQEDTSDKFDMDVINQNMDILDEALAKTVLKLDEADERLKAVESSVEITKPTLTVNTTYIASSRLYCHKVGKLVFVQGTITTSAEVPAWTTGLISGLPTISQTYYFKLFRTGSTVGSPTVYLNGGGTTVNVDNNALAAEATYYLNFCYIEH